MRRGRVLNHGQLAGLIEELDDGSCRFTYDPAWLASGGAPVSLALPTRSEPYTSPGLFPFFFGLLAEGSARALQHRLLRIDEQDHFGLLLATAADSIGSVSVEPEEPAR